MNFAGKINVVSFENVPDLKIGTSIMNLRSILYYPYYSQQTMVGEGIFS